MILLFYVISPPIKLIVKYYPLLSILFEIFSHKIAKWSEKAPRGVDLVDIEL